LHKVPVTFKIYLTIQKNPARAYGYVDILIINPDVPVQQVADVFGQLGIGNTCFHGF
jgi:hypothetical protein